MMWGVRCLLAAIRCEKGDVAGNLASHLEIAATAAAAGCELAVFPEMSLTGSADPVTAPGYLISLDHPAVTELAAVTARTGLGICFGVAERGPDGEPYITQVFAAAGQVTGIQRKRHLGEGEEAYTTATASAVFEHHGTKFAIAICAEARLSAPFSYAAAAGARLVLFPAAPGLYGRRTDTASWRTGFEWWESCSLGDARRHAARLRLWVALASQAGSTVDEDFPGLAALVSPQGTVTARLLDWQPELLTVDIPL
jgi:predicted amidohydrolase